MNTLKIAALTSLILAFFTIHNYAQEIQATDAADAVRLDKVRPDQVKATGEVLLNTISSTAAGGPWSSPSTWVGGVVPGSSDSVTIVSGAAVVIDTTASAGALTVGSGGSPAALTFDPSSARSLTVSGNLTIAGAGDTLASAGTGSVTNHTLSVGGDLTNNGSLDLSTNSDQAGADLVFTGASNNTFGGGGAVTDIRTITMNKGASSDVVLELTVANFTVRGSTTDSAASAFLTLSNGTFKISGTFTGSHRTGVESFDPHITAFEQVIGPTAGLWINNPNYTVTPPSNQTFWVKGLLRVSAGTLNTGRSSGLSIMLDQSEHPAMIVDGGAINVSGVLVHSFGTNPYTYDQSGGKVTTCMVENPGGNCFRMSTGMGGGNVTFSGGEIVIQNPALPAVPPSSNSNDYSTGGTVVGVGTLVRFGNASTVAAGPFRAGAGAVGSDVMLDTSAGPQGLIFGNRVRNMNIGTNGTVDLGAGGLQIYGDSFVNNGNITATNGWFYFHGSSTAADVNYSGTGTMTGKFLGIAADCHSLTFGSSVGNIRAGNVELHATNLTNSSKITFADNANITIYNDGKFDSPPVYDLMPTGGVSLIYRGGHTTGPEVPANRIVRDLTNYGPGPLVLDGGDITVTGALNVGTFIQQGTNKITHLGVGGGGSQFMTGYVDGRLARPFTAGDNGVYTYLVGGGGIRTKSTVFVTGMQSSPTTMSIKAIDSAMPGLPGTTATRYWNIQATGPIHGSKIEFEYAQADVVGNEGKYRLWHSVNGGPAVLCGGGQVRSEFNLISCTGFADYAGDWGIAEFDDPGHVSLSGLVTEANGNPISNASVILTSEGRPPVTVFTGSLGSYVFPNLEAGIVYTLTVSAKRHRFTVMDQQVTPMGNLTSINFVAKPPES